MEQLYTTEHAQSIAGWCLFYKVHDIEKKKIMQKKIDII